MSNPVCIDSCKLIVEYNNTHIEIIKVEDNYDNIIIYPSEHINIDDHMKILSLFIKDDRIMGYSSSKDAILDAIIQEEKGVTINGKYYDWDEIKQVFNQE